MWSRSISFEKSKNLFLTFQEKYWINLPPELNWIISKIKSNLVVWEQKELNKHWWDRIISQYKRVFTLKEHESLQRWISKLTLKIQENDSEIMWGWNWESVKKEICSIISKTLFSNLCKISIENKWHKPVMWRFEKCSMIENEHFDIIFTYSYVYEQTFKYIFEEEKSYIKEQVLQLIDIYKNYSEVYQLFETVMKLVWESFEKKHPYTAWHIDRVKHFSMLTWKILWFNHLEIKVLEAQAMMHDYWKDFIPEEILKKTWKFTDEEKKKMSEHTWIWIMHVIDNNYNSRLMEWMPHHCFYYSPEWDNDLTLEKWCEEYKQSRKFEPTLFNRLQWRNIPMAARIIEIWDIVDAVASRRIYDDRSWWPIETMLQYIQSELLWCSWLIFDKWNIYPDPKKWEIIEGSPEFSPYLFETETWYYKPVKGEKIQLDPHIVSMIFKNPENLRILRKELINKDIANINIKIDEFEDGIKLLESKKERFQKIRSSLPKNFDISLIQDYVFTEDNENDLSRLKINLPKLFEIVKQYGWKVIHLNKR